MQTWKTGVAVLAAAATLLTGCGGSDDDDADVGASASVDAEELGDELEDAGVAGDCADAIAAMSAAGSGMSSAFTGDMSDLEDAVEAMEEYADAAPEEIREDFQLVAEAYGRFVAVVVENDVDLSGGGVPDEETMAALEEASEGLDDEELTAASERIQAYFEEECEA